MGVEIVVAQIYQRSSLGLALGLGAPSRQVSNLELCRSIAPDWIVERVRTVRDGESGYPVRGRSDVRQVLRIGLHCADVRFLRRVTTALWR